MRYSSSMYSSLKHVIMKHPRDAFKSQDHLSKNWKTFNYLREPKFDEASKEFSELVNIIEQQGTQIDYLPSNDTVGLDSIYAHDPVKFTPAGALILKSGKKLRQPEATVVKEFLAERDIPIIGELAGDAVSDAGDIVWLEDRTLLVGRGYRTNDEAIRQLKEMTADLVDEFIVVQLPHDQGEEECLHLMSFLSVVDKDLAVVHSPLMPVFLRQLLLQKGFQLIEVPKKEYDTLGCNVLAIAPRVCVLTNENAYTIQQLKDAGATVHVYKGQEISLLGTGGPTCLTCPVVRG
ncbi:arginine deiminase family protein [Sporosarcina aquimarina]|uniref:dimethylarginine dimethylaminohydrolase family protein n=1 Tax=Sporosarcina aquimarina TaxID=114975 RepID=UPI00203FE791|nr:arginine deiminase family protein [Sporosarcina aquimarina]MCM3756207.1 arginine deiminase family protein [Sporosarcina aquimarina]